MNSDEMGFKIKVELADAMAAMSTAESAAKKTERTFDGLGSTFAKIGREQKRMADEIAASRIAALNATNAFSGLAQQLEREGQMLDRIHGPAQRAARDLTTLESLMRSGKITAEQYAAELERIGNAAGHVRAPDGVNPADAVSLKMPEATGPSFLTKAGAVGALTMAAGEALKLDESFAHAQNSLRKFADTDLEVNALLARTTDVAYDLHMNMEEGARIYGEVGEATASLYLTTKQQVDIMKGLGEIAQNDGGEIGEMMGMMKQLTFAMDAGTISGRELKGMMKQSDDVAQLWVDRLGMSRTELIKQANAGKIGSAQLREMILALQGGADTTKKHEERSHSLTETLVQLKDRALEPLSVKLGRWVAELQDSWEPLNQTIKLNERLHDSLENVLETMGHTTQLATMASSFIGLSDVLKQANANIKDYDAVAQLTGMNLRKGYHDSVDQLNRALAAGQISQAQFTEGMHAAAKAAGMVADKANAATKAVQGMQGAFPWGEADAISGGKMTGHLNPDEHWMTADDLKSNVDTETWEETLRNAKQASDAMQKMADDSAKAIDESNKKLVEDRTKRIDEIADHLKPIEDALVELALKGEMSWRKMTDAMIADLLRVAIRQGEVALIGAIAGGGAGAAAGAVSGGNHAFGGSYTAPGTGGGQDSIPVMFRMSPHERVDFTPMGGWGSGGGPGNGQNQRSAPPQLNIALEDNRDPRALLRTADFRRAVLDVAREHPSAFAR